MHSIRVLLLVSLVLITSNSRGQVEAAFVYVDGVAGVDSTSCGGSTGTACATLAAAVDLASTGDTVVIASGVYCGNGNAGVTLDKRINIAAAAVSSPLDVHVRCFDMATSACRTTTVAAFYIRANISISGISFTNCPTALDVAAGATANDPTPAAALDVSDCTFHDCGWNTTIHNSTLSFHAVHTVPVTTIPFAAGGISVRTINASHTASPALSQGGLDMTISRTTFSNITTSAIASKDGTGLRLTLLSSTFINNSVTTGASDTIEINGGAVAVVPPGQKQYSFINATDCVFQQHYVNGYGGVLYAIGSNVAVTVTRCTFTDNHALRSGGALYVTQGSDLRVNNCTMSGNIGGPLSGIGFQQSRTIAGAIEWSIDAPTYKTANSTSNMFIDLVITKARSPNRVHIVPSISPTAPTCEVESSLKPPLWCVGPVASSAAVQTAIATAVASQSAQAMHAGVPILTGAVGVTLMGSGFGIVHYSPSTRVFGTSSEVTYWMSDTSVAIRVSRSSAATAGVGAAPGSSGNSAGAIALTVAEVRGTISSLSRVPVSGLVNTTFIGYSMNRPTTGANSMTLVASNGLQCVSSSARLASSQTEASVWKSATALSAKPVAITNPKHSSPILVASVMAIASFGGTAVAMDRSCSFDIASSLFVSVSSQAFVRATGASSVTVVGTAGALSGLTHRPRVTATALAASRWQSHTSIQTKMAATVVTVSPTFIVSASLAYPCSDNTGSHLGITGATAALALSFQAITDGASHDQTLNGFLNSPMTGGAAITLVSHNLGNVQRSHRARVGGSFFMWTAWSSDSSIKCRSGPEGGVSTSIIATVAGDGPGSPVSVCRSCFSFNRPVVDVNPRGLDVTEGQGYVDINVTVAPADILGADLMIGVALPIGFLGVFAAQSVQFVGWQSDLAGVRAQTTLRVQYSDNDVDSAPMSYIMQVVPKLVGGVGEEDPLTTVDVNVTLLDDGDAAGIIVDDSTTVVLSETTTAAIRLRLSSRPTAVVNITVALSETVPAGDFPQLLVATPHVVIAPAAWNLWHSVNIVGVQDWKRDGNQSVSLTASVSDIGTFDAIFPAVPAVRFNVTVMDERQGIVASATVGNVPNSCVAGADCLGNVVPNVPMAPADVVSYGGVVVAAAKNGTQTYVSAVQPPTLSSNEFNVMQSQAGVYTVNVVVHDLDLAPVHIAGSPFSLQVLPAEVSATESIVTGALSVPAGTMTTLTVLFKDAYGNPTVAVAHVFALSVKSSLPPMILQSPSVAAVRSDISLAATAAEQYAVHVQLTSSVILLHIHSSPFHLTVQPSTPAPPLVMLTPHTTDNIVVNETIHVTIATRDVYGNDRTPDAQGTPLSDPLSVQIATPDPASPSPVITEAAFRPIRLAATRSGTYKVFVSAPTWPGFDMQEFSIEVRPGPIHRPSCSFHGEALFGSQVSVEVDITIDVRDRFGNGRPSGADTVLVLPIITSPSTYQFSPAVSPHPSMAGRYAAMFAPVIVGNYNISVLVGGLHIPGSPFLSSSVATVGSTTASTSTSFLVGPSTQRAGSNVQVGVTLRDSNSKRVRVTASTLPMVWVKLTLISSESVTLGPTLSTASSDGFAVASLHPTRIGQYIIAVRLGPSFDAGQTIVSNGAVLHVNIEPEVPYCLQSSSLYPPMDFVAGLVTSYTISLRDMFGNKASAAQGAVRDGTVSSTIGYTADAMAMNGTAGSAVSGDGVVLSGSWSPFDSSIVIVSIYTTQTGRFAVSITLNGTLCAHLTKAFTTTHAAPAPISDVTFAPSMSPLVSAAASSSKPPIVPSILLVTAGVGVHLRVWSMDMFGNPAHAMAYGVDVYQLSGDRSVSSTNAQAWAQWADLGLSTTSRDVLLNATMTGMYNISFTINGMALHQAIVLHVLPNRLDISGTSKWMPRPFASQYRAGETANVVVRMLDAFGNTLGAIGDVVSVAVDGPQTFIAIVTEADRGGHGVRVTFAGVTGIYTVIVKAKGSTVSKSTVAVLAGPLYPPRCVVGVGVPVVATAGVPKTFFVFPRDAFGNIQSPNAAVEAVGARIIGQSNSSLCTPQVFGQRYLCSVTATRAGSFHLAVTLPNAGNVDIGNGPFDAVVAPSPAVPQTTVVQNLASLATAGVATSFTVVCRDTYGNARQANEYDLDSPVVRVAVTHRDDPLQRFQPGSLVDDGSAYINATVAPTLAGIYSLDVLFGGTSAVPTITLKVRPNVLMPAHAKLRIDTSLALFQAHGQFTFDVVERDAFGNVRDDTEIPTFSMVMAHDGNARDIQVTRQMPTPGLHRIYAAFTSSGQWWLDIVLGGHPIQMSPFVSIVYPGFTDAANCKALGPGLMGGPVGFEQNVYVRAYDAYGNRQSHNSDHFYSMVEMPSRVVDVNGTMEYAVNVSKMQPRRDGFSQIIVAEYITTYTPNLQGHVTIGISLETTLQTTPLNATHNWTAVIYQYALLADPTTTVLTSPLAIRVGGSSLDVLAVTAGGVPEPFGTSIILAETPVGTNVRLGDTFMRHNADGVYYTSLFVTVAGNHTLAVRTQGKHIIGSPFTILAQPGTTVLPLCVTTVNVGGITALSNGTVTNIPAIAGDTVRVTIAPRDGFHNPQLWLGPNHPVDTFAVRVANVNAHNSHSTASARDWQTAVDGPSFHRADLLVTFAGEYHIDIDMPYRLPKEALRRLSPFVSVVPSPPSIAASVASGDGLSVATAGVVATFAISVRDQYGNVATTNVPNCTWWNVTINSSSFGPILSSIYQPGPGSMTNQTTNSSWNQTKSSTLAFAPIVNVSTGRKSVVTVQYRVTIAGEYTLNVQTSNYRWSLANVTKYYNVTNETLVWVLNATNITNSVHNNSATANISNATLLNMTNVAGSVVNGSWVLRNVTRTASYVVVEEVQEFVCPLHSHAAHRDMNRSPFTFVARPALPAPDCGTLTMTSNVVNASLTTILQFVMTRCDGFGNEASVPRVLLVVSISRNKSPTMVLSAPPDPLDSSRFNLALPTTKSGNYTLATRVVGALLPSTEFTVFVQTGVTHPCCVALAGGGLSIATAGVAATFTIRTHDVFGNPTDVVGVPVTVSFTSTLPIAPTVSKDIIRVGNAIHCNYTATRSGQYTMSVQIGDTAVPVANGHHTPNVETQTPHVPFNLEARTQVAGTGWPIAVRVLDVYGNTNLSLSTNFSAVLETVSGATVVDSSAMTLHQDLGSGLQQVVGTPTLTRSGIYTIHVRYWHASGSSSVLISDAIVATLRVTPNRAIATNSEFYTSTSTSQAGDSSLLEFRGKDVYGNIVPGRGPLFTVSFSRYDAASNQRVVISRECSQSTFAGCLDTSLGVDASVVLTVSGIYTVSARLGSLPIRWTTNGGNNLQQWHVHPASLHIGACIVSGGVSRGGYSTHPIAAEVFARDRFGNSISFGPSDTSPFVMVVNLQSPVTGSVASYTATATAVNGSTPSSWVLSVTLPEVGNATVTIRTVDASNVHAPGSPFLIKVFLFDTVKNSAYDATTNTLLALTLQPHLSTLAASAYGGPLPTSLEASADAASWYLILRTNNNVRNVVPRLASRLRFFVVGPSPQAPTVVDDDGLSGLYIARTQLTRSGQYSLVALLDELMIGETGAPIPLIVHPSSASPQHCTLEWERTTSPANAGSTVEVVVTERDRFGNVRLVPQVVVGHWRAESLRDTTNDLNGQTMPYNGTTSVREPVGEFTRVQLIATIPGQYRVRVLDQGGSASVWSLPFPIVVGPIVSATITLGDHVGMSDMTNGMTRVVAGDAFALKVRPHDAFGNAVAPDPETQPLDVSISHVALAPFRLLCDCAATPPESSPEASAFVMLPMTVHGWNVSAAAWDVTTTMSMSGSFTLFVDTDTKMTALTAITVMPDTQLRTPSSGLFAIVVEASTLHSIVASPIPSPIRADDALATCMAGRDVFGNVAVLDQGDLLTPKITLTSPCFITRQQLTTFQICVDFVCPMPGSFSISIAAGSSIGTVAHFAVLPLPPPLLIRAQFTDLGVGITVTFDQATDRGGMAFGSHSCTSLFEGATLALLGDMLSCRVAWLNDEAVLVHLGVSATISTNNVVELRRGIVRNARRNSDSNTGTVRLLRPARPPTPTARLTAPSVIPMCSDLQIDSSRSRGRELTREWSVIAQPLPAEGARRLHTFLSTLDPHSRIITIPASYLTEGTVHTFVMRVTCALCFGPSETSIAVTPTFASVLPVTISTQEDILTVGEETVLTASAMPCPPTLPNTNWVLQYKWRAWHYPRDLSMRDTSIPMYSGRSIVIGTGTNQALTLQTDGLSPGHVVLIVNATATLTSVNGTVLSGSANYTLALDDRPLSVKIIGGDRAHPRGDVLRIESMVYPPTAASHWTCRDALLDTRCDIPIAWLEMGTASGLELPTHLDSLPNNSTMVFTIHVFDLANAENPAFASVTVTLIDNAVRAVIATPVPRKVAAGRALEIVVDAPGPYTWVWTSSSGDFSHRTRKQLSSCGGGGAQLSHRLSLDHTALIPGQTYRFEASSIGAIGRASVVFTVNSPPLGGRCSLTPTSGLVLQTLFTVVCWDWVDDVEDLPLTYMLSLGSPGTKHVGRRPAMPLTAALPWATMRVKLPSGTRALNFMFNVTCRISDTLWAPSFVDMPVRVDYEDLFRVEPTLDVELGAHDGLRNLVAAYAMAGMLHAQLQTAGVNTRASSHMTVTKHSHGAHNNNSVSNSTAEANSTAHAHGASNNASSVTCAPFLIDNGTRVANPNCSGAQNGSATIPVTTTILPPLTTPAPIIGPAPATTLYGRLANVISTSVDRLPKPVRALSKSAIWSLLSLLRSIDPHPESLQSLQFYTNHVDALITEGHAIDAMEEPEWSSDAADLATNMTTALLAAISTWPTQRSLSVHVAELASRAAQARITLPNLPAMGQQVVTSSTAFAFRGTKCTAAEMPGTRLSFGSIAGFDLPSALPLGGMLPWDFAFEARAMLYGDAINPHAMAESVTTQGRLHSIVSLTLFDSSGVAISLDELDEPVRITLPLLATNATTATATNTTLTPANDVADIDWEETPTMCVFWNETRKAWSRRGCLVLDAALAGGELPCSCFHLSDFTSLPSDAQGVADFPAFAQGPVDAWMSRQVPVNRGHVIVLSMMAALFVLALPAALWKDAVDLDDAIEHPFHVLPTIESQKRDGSLGAVIMNGLKFRHVFIGIINHPPFARSSRTRRVVAVAGYVCGVSAFLSWTPHYSPIIDYDWDLALGLAAFAAVVNAPFLAVFTYMFELIARHPPPPRSKLASTSHTIDQRLKQFDRSIPDAYKGEPEVMTVAEKLRSEQERNARVRGVHAANDDAPQRKGRLAILRGKVKRGLEFYERPLIKKPLYPPAGGRTYPAAAELIPGVMGNFMVGIQRYRDEGTGKNDIKTDISTHAREDALALTGTETDILGPARRSLEKPKYRRRFVWEPPPPTKAPPMQGPAAPMAPAGQGIKEDLSNLLSLRQAGASIKAIRAAADLRAHEAGKSRYTGGVGAEDIMDYSDDEWLDDSRAGSPGPVSPTTPTASVGRDLAGWTLRFDVSESNDRDKRQRSKPRATGRDGTEEAGGVTDNVGDGGGGDKGGEAAAEEEFKVIYPKPPPTRVEKFFIDIRTAVNGVWEKTKKKAQKQKQLRDRARKKQRREAMRKKRAKLKRVAAGGGGVVGTFKRMTSRSKIAADEDDTENDGVGGGTDSTNGVGERMASLHTSIVSFTHRKNSRASDLAAHAAVSNTSPPPRPQAPSVFIVCAVFAVFAYSIGCIWMAVRHMRHFEVGQIDGWLLAVSLAVMEVAFVLDPLRILFMAIVRWIIARHRARAAARLMNKALEDPRVPLWYTLDDNALAHALGGADVH